MPCPVAEIHTVVDYPNLVSVLLTIHTGGHIGPPSWWRGDMQNEEVFYFKPSDTALIRSPLSPSSDQNITPPSFLSLI